MSRIPIKENILSFGHLKWILQIKVYFWLLLREKTKKQYAILNLITRVKELDQLIN